MEVQITVSHWVYLLTVLTVVVLMIRKRDVVLPCIIGSFVIGLLFRGSVVGAIQSVFTGLETAGTELFDIMLVIALMVAMLKSLQTLGADYLMVSPVRNFMKTPFLAYWILGAVMYLAASFFWPTPATALVGTLLIPVAINAGLPAIGAAMAVNLLGHGMALSGDLVIQGALKLSAQAAQVPVEAMFSKAAVLAWVAGLTAGIVGYISIQKDIKQARDNKDGSSLIAVQAPQNITSWARWFAAGVPIVLLAVVIAMVVGKIRGGAATALLGGTGTLILVAATLAQHGKDALEKLVGYLREGLLFAIKIFAPVIPIAGFFYLGSPKIAPSILGEGAPGLLFDLGRAFSQIIPLGKIPLAFGNMIVGVITGLDGSGFSGLPLTGSLAQALGGPAGVNVSALAAVGQIGAIWSGGGTLVAWAFGLVATAGIAGVSPLELARRNFIPVACGLLAATIVGIIMM